MACDRYWELLSARLDGELTETESRELDAHLAVCPECRAAGVQLAALQKALPELEDAPEGFVQGVMDRVRAEQRKTVPLLRRSGVRALAALAACAALAVGAAGLAQRAHNAWDMTAGLAGGSGSSGVETPDASPAERCMPDGYSISPYAAPEKDPDTDALDAEALDGIAPQSVTPDTPEAMLVLERMPEGAEELLFEITPLPSEDGGAVYQGLSLEQLAQVERLAAEQGIGVWRREGGGENGLYALTVLEE